MNRRNFFSRLGITAAAAVAAPTALAAIAEEIKAPETIEPPKEPWIDKKAFDAEMDYNHNAHQNWMILSKGESEADFMLGHMMDKQLFLGTGF